MSGTWFMMQAAARRWRDAARPGCVVNIVAPTAKALPLREVVAARAWLNAARFSFPGSPVPLRLVGLRALGFRLPLWNEDGDKLVHAVTGQVLVPDVPWAVLFGLLPWVGIAWWSRLWSAEPWSVRAARRAPS